MCNSIVSHLPVVTSKPTTAMSKSNIVNLCAIVLFLLWLFSFYESSTADPISSETCMTLDEQFASSKMALVGGSSDRLWLVNSDLLVFEVPLYSLSNASLDMTKVETPVPLQVKWPKLGGNDTFKSMFAAKQFANAISLAEQNDTALVFATDQNNGSFTLFAYNLNSEKTTLNTNLTSFFGGKWISSDKVNTFYTIQNVNDTERISVQRVKIDLGAKQVEKQSEQVMCFEETQEQDHFQVVIGQNEKCKSANLGKIVYGIESDDSLFLFETKGVLILPHKIFVARQNNSNSATWQHYSKFIVCSDEPASETEIERVHKWTVIIILVIMVLLVILCFFFCMLCRQRPEPKVIVRKPIPSKAPTLKTPSVSMPEKKQSSSVKVKGGLTSSNVNMTQSVIVKHIRSLSKPQKIVNSKSKAFSIKSKLFKKKSIKHRKSVVSMNRSNTVKSVVRQQQSSAQNQSRKSRSKSRPSSIVKSSMSTKMRATKMATGNTKSKN